MILDDAVVNDGHVADTVGVRVIMRAHKTEVVVGSGGGRNRYLVQDECHPDGAERPLSS